MSNEKRLHIDDIECPCEGVTHYQKLARSINPKDPEYFFVMWIKDQDRTFIPVIGLDGFERVVTWVEVILLDETKNNMIEIDK